jgi:hypothetical protein
MAAVYQVYQAKSMHCSGFLILLSEFHHLNLAWMVIE